MLVALFVNVWIGFTAWIAALAVVLIVIAVIIPTMVVQCILKRQICNLLNRILPHLIDDTIPYKWRQKYPDIVFNIIGPIQSHSCLCCSRAEVIIRLSTGECPLGGQESQHLVYSSFNEPIPDPPESDPSSDNQSQNDDENEDDDVNNTQPTDTHEIKIQEKEDEDENTLEEEIAAIENAYKTANEVNVVIQDQVELQQTCTKVVESSVTNLKESNPTEKYDAIPTTTTENVVQESAN